MSKLYKVQEPPDIVYKVRSTNSNKAVIPPIAKGTGNPILDKKKGVNLYSCPKTKTGKSVNGAIGEPI